MTNSYNIQGVPAVGKGLPGLPTATPQTASAITTKQLYSTSGQIVLKKVPGEEFYLSSDTALLAAPSSPDRVIVGYTYSSTSYARAFDYGPAGLTPLGTQTSNGSIFGHLLRQNATLADGSIISCNTSGQVCRAFINPSTLNVSSEVSFTLPASGTTTQGWDYTRININDGLLTGSTSKTILRNGDHIVIFDGLMIAGGVHVGAFVYHATTLDLLGVYAIFQPTLSAQTTAHTQWLSVLYIKGWYHFVFRDQRYSGSNYQLAVTYAACSDNFSEVIAPVNGLALLGPATTNINHVMAFAGDERSVTMFLISSAGPYPTSMHGSKASYLSDIAFQVRLNEDGKPIADANNKITTPLTETTLGNSFQEIVWYYAPNNQSNILTANYNIGGYVIPSSDRGYIGTNLTHYNETIVPGTWNAPAFTYETVIADETAIVAHFKPVIVTEFDDDSTATTYAYCLRAFPLENGYWLGVSVKGSSSNYIALFEEV